LGRITWADQGVIASGSSAWTGVQVTFANIGGDARADQGVIATGVGVPGARVHI
jgi:hypothetical protein